MPEEACATITAIITAYHPDDRLPRLIEAALQQCEQVLVVDNTPLHLTAAPEVFSDSRARVIRQGANHGLAHALNTAAASLEPGCQAVLLMDQDSVLPDGLVATLVVALGDASVGIVAPTPVDVDDGRRYQRGLDSSAALRERDAVITSGMIIRTSALQAVGSFREEFFVDWVDNDFCLRLRKEGLRILQHTNVCLPHAIGEKHTRSYRGKSVRIIRYPPWRHYWITRNGIVLVREHAWGRPYWALQALLYLGRQAVTALAADDRLASILAITRGFIDGVRGSADLRYLPEGAEYGVVIER